MTTTQPTPAPHQAEEQVRIYNKTERQFSHDHTNEQGVRTRHTIAGNSFAKVPRAVANLWLGMFPNEIVTDSEANKSINAAESRATEAEATIKKLEAEIERLKSGKKKKASSLDHV